MTLRFLLVVTIAAGCGAQDRSPEAAEGGAVGTPAARVETLLGAPILATTVVVPD